MWSPGTTFDPTAQMEGFVLRHLDGQPPTTFRAEWPRDATIDNVIDALEAMLDALVDYECK